MLKKRIQMFGAGLFVMAAMLVGTVELMRPVEAAAQRTDCCSTKTPGTCAGGLTCVAGGTDGCPVNSPSYDGHCAKSGRIIVNEPGGGDS
jgi:hypothetical protein